MMNEMAEPVQQSYLMWMYSALGIKYALLLPASAASSFVVTLLLVVRGKGAFAAAAIVLVVSLPLLVGIVGALDGTMASFAVISVSSVTPKPSEWARGVSMALVAPWLGFWLMVPTFLLATIGSAVRAITVEAGDADKAMPK